MQLSKYAVLLLCLLALSTCGSDDENDPVSDCTQNFDQSAMFNNLADNVIIPAYLDFQTSSEQLKTLIDAFIASPDANTLGAAQDQFKATYLSWQDIAQYEFGPAEAVFLRNNVNNFPLDEAALNSNIQGSSYDLKDPNAFDKGLPALDYLLFGLGATADDILVFYTTDGDADTFKNYLQEIIQTIQDLAAEVHDEWTGGYKATFTGGTGTAAGTSLSLIINNLNQNYELIKREKLGLPSGVLTLDIPNPDKVEAPYSGISAALAVRAIKASKALFIGDLNSNNDRRGLDDYLEHVDAMKDNTSLADLIINQYDKAIEVVEALPDPLAQAIEDDRESVVNAYNEVVRQIVNTKTDMPSVLCVSITYVDNPSDSD